MALAEASVWVTKNDANAVVQIDPRTNQVVATIRVGDPRPGVSILALAAGAGSLWVVAGRAETVYRLDPRP